MDLHTAIQAIRESKLFDAAWYERTYPDVTASKLDPLAHFLRFGHILKRNPSPNFDTAFYLSEYKDVSDAKLNPLLHYIMHGAKEGRLPKGVAPVVAKDSTKPCAALVKNKSISVVWVCNPHDKMTNYYRVHNYAAGLAKLGVVTKIARDSEFAALNLEEVDVLILCRIAASKEMLAKIDSFRESGRVVIFDIDDLVFNPQYLLNIRHVAERSDAERARFERLMVGLQNTLWRCDFATVSTHALRKEINRLGKQALIVPNTISEEEIARRDGLLTAKAARKTQHVRIGYCSGTKSHEVDFSECSDALFSLMERYENIEFMVIGHLECVDRFRKFGRRFISLQLLPHAEMLEKLSTCDINIAPLEWRNPFVQGKSELKIFEAALYGIPSVVSPTASYAAAVEDGLNGFVAWESADWISHLEALVLKPDLRRRVGSEAYETIAKRHFISTTAPELFAVLKAAKAKAIRPLRACPTVGDRIATPAISVVTVLYKKAHEVSVFLETMRRQTFELPYEIIFVDDCSPDDSVSVVERFVELKSRLSDTNRNMTVRVVRNQKNEGNCTSRNRGFAEARGELIVVVDADCLFNSEFLSAHYYAHQQGTCDVAIGPKGIETNGRPPLSVLSIYEADPQRAEGDANPQDAVNPDSFINCVTRNLSISRAAIEKVLRGELFDELFNYSAKPESGFGWEDVELGYRLYAGGARISFLPETASIHISHAPTVENADKPLRSLKNFRRLHEKHPRLYREAALWTQRTYAAIINWCNKLNCELERNADRQFLDNHFGAHAISPALVKRHRRLRVLTYRWHCPHQWELFKLGHDYTLVRGLGTAICEDWDWRKRPLPRNAHFISHERVNPRDFDIAVLHFDENVLRPDACLGKVPPNWGRTFLHALSEWNIPKVAICHGTPQFRGQYDASYTGADLEQVVEESRAELVELLKGVPVVCNSYQAQSEWSFAQSVVIWHGFSPHEYPPNLSGEGFFSMGQAALENRPHYNGLRIMDQLRSSLDGAVNIDTLDVPDPAPVLAPRTSEWAFAKYRNYISAVGRYSVYVNPTKRSPMPRTRGEAMMAGLATVSLRNHDVDMFIRNGDNGFFADTPEEMAEHVKFLSKNPQRCEEMGRSSRATALKLFNQDRYLSEWSQLIENILGSDAKPR